MINNKNDELFDEDIIIIFNVIFIRFELTKAFDQGQYEHFVQNFKDYCKEHAYWIPYTDNLVEDAYVNEYDLKQVKIPS